MLFFFVTFIAFTILLHKSFPALQTPLPSWATETRLLSVLFVRDSVQFVVDWIKSCELITSGNSDMVSVAASKKRCNSSKMDNVEEIDEFSVLDLPDLALESILGKLSPAGLSNMAAVCSSLREKCRSDYMWEQHMTKKWGKVIGSAAQKEWKLYLASMRESVSLGSNKAQKRWLGALSCVWPISWIKSRIDGGIQARNFVPEDSIMSWYLSLESGKFWFPAQVYNREHGHVGFMLSCYDAEVSYDCSTDTFNARYPPHGRRTIVIEEGVQWDRLRAPPVDTPAHELHASDCLHELRPGDHIEIQWRRNKEFPYGWWYGSVGHLESCDGNEHFCRCHLSDTVILEFNQYTPGSRWRRSAINRKDHTEEGSETDGFYGGIRKLKGAEEISKWKQLWPTDILE